jgi:coiled-coil and C2 domain-containing protein 2A
VRTRVATGSSPSWQESLVLPFRPPGGDFSPAALQASSDVVGPVQAECSRPTHSLKPPGFNPRTYQVISWFQSLLLSNWVNLCRYGVVNIVLFDEHVKSSGGSGGGGRRSSTGGGDSVGGGSESAVTRHYLGSIDIPIAALYKADGAKLEGVLPLEQPPVLLGYTPAPGVGGGGGGGNGGMGQQRQGGLSTQARPSLSVYIQFNPTLAKPEPAPMDPGMGEDDALLRHAHRWVGLYMLNPAS